MSWFGGRKGSGISIKTFDQYRSVDLRTLQNIDSPKKLVAESESAYEARLDAAVEKIAKSGASLLLLAGPSGSGKTTTSLKLAKRLESLGRHAAVISMDDFFRNLEDYPLRRDGTPDFDHFGALDTELFHETFGRLLDTGKAELPLFDFNVSHRRAETRPMVLEKGSVVIVEGIHALNPKVSESLPADRILRIFVCPMEEYSSAHLGISSADLRISRRIIRDARSRGYEPEQTLAIWSSIRQGEETNIFPFVGLADLSIDSSFRSEPGILSKLLRELCFREGVTGEDYETLLALSGKFSAVSEIDASLLPQESMLREFVGGLCL